MTPMQVAAAEYMAHGWRLCRINPGKKGPLYSGWNLPGAHLLTAEDVKIGWGVGLLHAYSGTMALDIDHYPTALTYLQERGIDLDALLSADDAVQIVSGRVNSAKLLYALSEPRVGKAVAEYVDAEGKKKLALDFRCMAGTGGSQQDCLPPTMHPKQGKPYQWLPGILGDWRSLPPIPTALDALWAEFMQGAATTASPQTLAPVGAGHEKIWAWLQGQDPGCSRPEWVKVGAKLHHEFQGSRDGFNIWCQWSARDDKWSVPDKDGHMGAGEADAVWRSFRLDVKNPATLGTDLARMPADPSEFAIVATSEEVGTVVPNPGTLVAVGELVESETPYDRAARELLESWVVYQTGGNKPFFILPGHPEKAIADAAGLAGAEKTHDQLGSIFAPYMPDKPHPKLRAMERMDAITVLRNAKWRKQVHRMAFNPGGPTEYFDDDGHRYLNAYKAIPIVPEKPTASQIAPLEWLLRRVLDEDRAATGGIFASWLVRLYAFVLQNPGVKVKWAPLLYSAEQGTGKTTLMETLPALLFGRQYVKPMVHSVLRERFAGAKFDSTWWVCLSEMHSDAGKIDAKTIANKLKPWITDSTIQIEKKGVDSYEIKNHLQFTAVSNHDDALFIEEGSTDRRWLVGEMLGQPLTPNEMAMLNPLFGDEYKRDPRAQPWLHWYFKENVNLVGFNPAEPPPQTAAKKRVIEQSHSIWEDEIQLAMDARSYPFDKDIVAPVDIAKGLLVGKGVSLALAKTLLRRAGGQEMPRFDFARNLVCMWHANKWLKATGAEVRNYLQSGKRPFSIVDGDGSDLIG